MTDRGIPQNILRRLPGWDARTARVRPLKGGITNQNFRVDLRTKSYVLRLNGAGSQHLGIRRNNERACTLLAAERGVGPELIDILPTSQGMVTRFIAGKPVSPAAARTPAMLRRIVSSIRKVHSGPAFPGRFSPFKAVRAYHCLAVKVGVKLPSRFDISQVFGPMARMEMALTAGASVHPCHNDLLASNFIDDGKTIRIIDWEYAAMGDPFFDLGNFAANQQLSGENCLLLLREYFGEAQRKDAARLHLYRLSSDLREAFWGFLQSGISTIDFDFIGYGAKHLDRFLRNVSGRRFELWLEDVGSSIGKGATYESSFPDWKKRLSRAKRESREGKGVLLEDHLSKRTSKNG